MDCHGAVTLTAHIILYVRETTRLKSIPIKFSQISIEKFQNEKVGCVVESHLEKLLKEKSKAMMNGYK